MNWGAIKTALDTIALFLAIGAWLYTWASNRDRARHAEIVKLQEALERERDRRREVCDALGDRMTHAEARLDDAPTGKALHEVALSISHLSGDLKEMFARLEGLGEVVKRLERVTSRQEEYLLNRPKGA